MHTFVMSSKSPDTPYNCLFCEILVDIPSSIWTSFALFTSIYLAVFGQEICFVMTFWLVRMAVFRQVLNFLRRYTNQYLDTFCTFYTCPRS